MARTAPQAPLDLLDIDASLSSDDRAIRAAVREYETGRHGP
jgi:hypothetical protein